MHPLVKILYNMRIIILSKSAEIFISLYKKNKNILIYQNFECQF